jgi:hypothetical protein
MPPLLLLQNTTTQNHYSPSKLLSESYDNVASETYHAPYIEAYDSCSVNCHIGEPTMDAKCKVHVFILLFPFLFLFPAPSVVAHRSPPVGDFARVCVCVCFCPCRACDLFSDAPSHNKS